MPMVLRLSWPHFLTLTLSKSLGNFRVDMPIGSTQRFEVPMVFGGTHVIFLYTSQECKRIISKRILGVCVDSNDKPTLRIYYVIFLPNFLL